MEATHETIEESGDIETGAQMMEDGGYESPDMLKRAKGPGSLTIKPGRVHKIARTERLGKEEEDVPPPKTHEEDEEKLDQTEDEGGIDRFVVSVNKE